MQDGLTKQFLTELLRFQQIGLQIAALSKESTELRKRLMAAYEDSNGKIGEKEQGEFLFGNELFTFMRDVTGKEITILFRRIKQLEIEPVTGETPTAPLE